MTAPSGPACPLCTINSLRPAGVCETCLRKGLRAHNQLLSRYQTSAHAARVKAAQHLQSAGGDRARILRAGLESKAQRVKLAKQETQRLRQRCLQQREDLAARKSSLQIRRENLDKCTARLSNGQPAAARDETDPFISSENGEPTAQELKVQWTRVAAALAEARQSACLQAVDAFHIQTVVETGPVFFDAPLPEGKPRNDDVHVLCNIAGCILPPIKDLKQYPPDEITAAVSHTAYLVRLLAMYLGVRLPFALSLGARSTIKAAPFTVWQERYSSSQPLFISASAVKQAAESSTFSSPSRSKATPQTNAEGSPNSASSSVQTNSATRALAPFVTALSMLSYDIAFICCSALRLPLTPQLQASGPLNMLLCAVAHFTQPIRDTLSDATVQKELSRRSRSHATALRPLNELNLVIGGGSSNTMQSTMQASVNGGGGSASVMGFPELLELSMASLDQATSSSKSPRAGHLPASLD